MQIASRGILWKGGRIPKDKTVLFLNVTAASMTARISRCTPAPDSTSITIDWGDKTFNEYAYVEEATHTYSFCWRRVRRSSASASAPAAPT